MTAESPGFSKIVRTGVTLQVAQVARIDVTLQRRPAQRDGRSRRRHVAARHADLLARAGDRPEEDRRAAAERARLQPARPALARRAAGHAAAGQRQFQGRAERQRQPHLQQRLPARRRGQHLVLELVPRRERPARAAVDRGAAGIQDSDERVFGRVRAQLGRGRQRHDQVRHQHGAGQRLRVPAQRRVWMRTTSSRTRSARRNRSGSATSSARRSAARSSGTGRSGSATTRACAIRRASRASAWCRRPPRRPACSAPSSSIRSRPGARRSARTRRGSGSSRRERWDPVGAAIVALIPDPNGSRAAAIYASTPVTDTRQDQFDVRIDHQFTTQPHVLRTLQLRRHADVPSGAAAGAGGGLVQRRLRIERQPIAGAGARRDLDDLADFRRRHPVRVRRAATTTRTRRTSASTARRQSG